MRRSLIIIMIIFSLSLGLAACGGKEAAGSGASQVVEKYLTALVAKDSDQLMSLTCAEWQADAAMELDAFQAVTARLQDVNCSEAGTSGDFTLVACEGAIVATYDGEDQALELAGRSYAVQQVGGDWLMCGYQ